MVEQLSDRMIACRMEHRLLMELKLPGFGVGRCHSIVMAYGSLFNLTRAPRIMALGTPGLSRNDRERLYELLGDENVKEMIRCLAERRSLLVGRSEKPVGTFQFGPVIEHLLGCKLSPRTMGYVLKRWKSGMFPLKDCITKRALLATTIPDSTHWNLMRIMHNTDRQAMAIELDPFRFNFEVKI